MIILFALLGTYTKKAHITGITIPKGGSILINSPGVGRVQAIFVREGDIVNAGAKLAETSNEREGRNGELSLLVAKQLKTRKSTLEYELTLRAEQYVERQRTFTVQIENLEKQLQRINEELAISARRYVMAQKSAQK